MKKLLFILTLILTSSLVYASFPVKKQTQENKTEIVLDHELHEYMDEDYGGTEFKFGPFLVGLLFGLIGVGLVHIFSNDKASKKNSWYGFGTWLILLLLLSV